jgi:predicted amidophosphoribosyltransferase
MEPAKELDKVEVARTIMENSPDFVCPLCNDQREVDGQPCPCCAKHSPEFNHLPSRVRRYAIVALAAANAMEMLAENPDCFADIL